MKLKEQIRDKGFRFNWIAEKIGRKPAELSMWLNGDRCMPSDVENKIKELIA